MSSEIAMNGPGGPHGRRLPWHQAWKCVCGFHSHSIGWHLVTWPQPVAREAEKCVLAVDSGRGEGGIRPGEEIVCH